MSKSILKDIQKKKSLGIKSLAVLIDPDAAKIKHLETTLRLAEANKVDYLFLGGSLILKDRMDECIKRIREWTTIPVVLFPGNPQQLDSRADALLFLSLLSGRNAEFLIGKQVEAAMRVQASNLEVLSTAYLLIDGGQSNSAAYISQTLPIPRNKPDIALATAMAGQLLNMQLLYLDAGSGARYPVSAQMVSALYPAIHMPVIVGGGIRNTETAEGLLRAGADMLVVGNALEDHPEWLGELAACVHSQSPIRLKS